MDLHRIIRDLREERELLDEAIRTLESMASVTDVGAGQKAVRRRGRTGMTQEERSAVSRRMKKYWRARRSE